MPGKNNPRREPGDGWPNLPAWLPEAVCLFLIFAATLWAVLR